MHRRTLLATTAVVLAGCSGDNGDGSETSDETVQKSEADLVVLYNSETMDGLEHPYNNGSWVGDPHTAYKIALTNQTEERVDASTAPVEPALDDALLAWNTFEEVPAGETVTEYLIYAVNSVDNEPPLQPASDLSVYLEQDSSLTVNVEPYDG